MSETAIFLNQPITIEAEANNNGSVVTLTSPNNESNFMQQLLNRTESWCTWIHSTYGREADARLENNQITCNVQAQARDLTEDGMIRELVTRLEGQGRAMGTSAGGGGGTTGEEDYERIRGA